ncbi:MAG: glycine cleavage system protein GcvH [Bacteroidetes bacterium]|nr:glycine cleavage system protein GcvH [Bacteroidota bacterium]
MKIPSNLKYTGDHEWVQVHDDGVTAKIGITDFAQSELGDIVFVELEPEGQSFEIGEVFGSVEAVKAVSELFLPVTATITRHNPGLEAEPEMVNNDPYGDGWMIEISLSDPSEIDNLLSADDYANHVK